MALRFHKSVRLAPGIRMNISKHGLSLSLGTKGLTMNLGRQRAKVTAGFPGTGLSFSKNLPSLRETLMSCGPGEPQKHFLADNDSLEQQLRAIRQDLQDSIRNGRNFELDKEDAISVEEVAEPRIGLSMEEKFRRFEPWGIFLLWSIALFIILLPPFPDYAWFAPLPALLLSRFTVARLKY